MKRYQRGFIEWLPAIATIGSSLIGAAGQRSANRQNVELGREQMAFQERMSGTAYQRAVQDMQAAGLNPMLAYSQGGASAPVGSMPQVQNVAAAAVNSAQQAMGMMSAVQQMRQSQALTEKTAAETNKIRAETQEARLYTSALEARIRQAGARADLDEQEFDYRSDVGYGGNKIRQKKEGAEAAKFDFSARDLETAWKRNRDSFGADVARRKADSARSVLGVDEAKAGSEFWKSAEDIPMWAKLFLQIINMSSAKGR